MIQQLIDNLGRLSRTTYEQPDLPTTSGIYAVTDDEKRVLYLGQADNMQVDLATVTGDLGHELTHHKAKWVYYYELVPALREWYYPTALSMLHPMFVWGDDRS